MIDSDIKADFDDVMTSNQLGFTNVDSLDLLNNLDDLETPFKFDSRYHGVDEVLNHPPQWKPIHTHQAIQKKEDFGHSFHRQRVVNKHVEVVYTRR